MVHDNDKATTRKDIKSPTLGARTQAKSCRRGIRDGRVHHHFPSYLGLTTVVTALL